MVKLIKEDSKYAIISVVGTHANEKIDYIFTRKIQETKKVGKTYWAYRSALANPKAVQEFGLRASMEKSVVICLFIEASSPNAAKPTKGSEKALFISTNKKEWNKIPDDNLITGSSHSSFALVLDKINLVNSAYIDLWKYSQQDNHGKAIRMMLGSSTVCSTKHPSKKDERKMKSRYRKLLAIGSLVFPYGVWLKY